MHDTNRIQTVPRLPRLFAADLLSRAGEVTLDNDQGHYLRDVLRMRSGDPLVLFDGSGWEYPATISSTTPTCVRVRITGKKAGMQESSVQLFLGVGLLKAHKMDLVVQKCVELGVHGIIPIASQRAVTTLNTKGAKEKQSRWEKIAREASRQCGRCLIAEIHPVVAIDQALKESARADLRIIFSAEAEGRVDRLAGYFSSGTVGRIFFLTGPEGGFTPEEEKKALETNFIPVRLGPRTLRAETAAIIATGLLQYRFGDLGEGGL